MINKKLNNKGGGFSIFQLLKLLLVIFVVVLVLVFLFKANITKYLRNLPDYSLPSEDENVSFTEVVDGHVRSSCPFRIGGHTKGKIFFCEGFDRGCKKKVISELFWKGGNVDAEIVIDRSWIIGDDHLGSVLENKISLEGGLFVKGNEYEEKLPEEKFLKNLNGAYSYGNNEICRKKLV